MVNFNSDATIGISPKNILAMIILQRRNDLIEAIESAKSKDLQGQTPNLSQVSARLLSLKLELEELLIRKLPRKRRKELEEIIKKDSPTIQEIINAYMIINKALDKTEITKIDTLRKLDFQDIEKMNEHFGYT